MLTLTLQAVSSVLCLLFGVLALAIARHAHALTPDRRAGWRMAGLAFTLIGASATLQDVAAVTAFFSGEGTWIYEGYLRVAPAANHSRSVLGVACAVILTRLAWSGRYPPRSFWRAATGALLGAMAVGGAVGWAEGAFRMEVHGAAVAVLLAVEIIAFSAVLLTSAARGTFDVFLFAALMLYALMMALSVPLFTGLSLGELLVGEVPGPWLVHLQAALFQTGMLGAAGVRLALLRRGVRVAEVFGRREAPLLPRLFD